MRSKKDNEEYFSKECEKKIVQMELYKIQDKKLIDDMTRDFKIRHIISTLIGVFSLFILFSLIYLNLD